MARAAILAECICEESKHAFVYDHDLQAQIITYIGAEVCTINDTQIVISTLELNI